MTNNIIKFPGGTCLDINPKEMLKNIEKEINDEDQILVIAWDKNDGYTPYCSTSNKAVIAWVLQLYLADMYNGVYTGEFGDTEDYSGDR